MPVRPYFRTQPHRGAWVYRSGDLTALKGTFTRADASTCATYVDEAGVVQLAAANVLRDRHYITGLGPYTLLEGARTNGLTESADLSVGSVPNSCTIGANAMAAPDGTLTADKIQEDATAGVEHGVSRNAAMPATTANTAQSVSVWVKAAERTWCILTTVNRDGAVWRTWFNLAAGVFGSINANHTARVLAVGGNGWYRLGISFNAGAAAGGLQFAVNASTADNTLTYNGVTGSGLYVWGRQWEADQPFPSSDIPTGASAVTRAADALSFPFFAPPQAMTVYVKGINQGVGYGSHLLIISVAGLTPPRLGLLDNGTVNGALYGQWYDGVGASNSVAPTAVAVGDRVEFLATLTASGVMTCSASVNGAAEVVGPPSAAVPLTGAFSGPLLTLSSVSGQVGGAILTSVRIAAGVQTMDTMRQIQRGDGRLVGQLK